jgi:hypothetical protein
VLGQEPTPWDSEDSVPDDPEVEEILEDSKEKEADLKES